MCMYIYAHDYIQVDNARDDKSELRERKDEHSDLKEGVCVAMCKTFKTVCLLRCDVPE